MFSSLYACKDSDRIKYIGAVILLDHDKWLPYPTHFAKIIQYPDSWLGLIQKMLVRIVKKRKKQKLRLTN